MRQLYYKCIIFNDLKNNVTIRRTYDIYYRDLPETIEKTLPIKDALKKINESCYHFYKSIYYYNDDQYRTCWFKENDLATVTIAYVPHTSFISFNKLSKQLPADEFIMYLKDRGLNTCPIIGGEK